MVYIFYTESDIVVIEEDSDVSGRYSGNKPARNILRTGPNVSGTSGFCNIIQMGVGQEGV